MKIGYQTIVFGPRIDDLEAVLDIIAGAGFTGVEFAQRPEMLRVCQNEETVPVRIGELRRLLAARGLTFLGIAGGTLDERMDFCDGVGDPDNPEPFRPLYLYVEECDAETQRKVAERGYDMALHTHVYMRLQRLSAAVRHLTDAAKRVPLTARSGRLFWLPDTAHLHIAGDDPEEALSAVPMTGMVAVHIKDWDSAFGRSYHRYARGFCPLDTGNVPVARVVAALRRMNYPGWLVVEKDYSRTFPHETLLRAADWLSAQGVMSPPSAVFREKANSLTAQTELAHFCSGDAKLSRADFTWRLMQASSLRLEEAYQVMAKALYDYFDSRFVALWACGPAREDMSLLASWPPNRTDEGSHVLLRRDERVGEAIERRTVVEFPVEDFIAGGSSWGELAQNVGARSIVAIPVQNRYNHHHIRFLVGLMQPEPGMQDYAQDAIPLSEMLARAADAALDDACSYVAGKVNFIANTTQTLRDFMTQLRDMVQQMVEAEGVTIFLVNRTRERLVDIVTTGIEWDANLPDNEHFYDRTHQHGATVRAWLEGMPILKPDLHNPKWGGVDFRPRSREKGPDVNRDRDNVLLVPLISTILDSDGNEIPTVIGIVRCRNKRTSKPVPDTPPPKLRIFTEDDAALVDSLCQAAVPHIELLRAEAIRSDAVGRLTHELAMPVNALRGAVDSLRTDLEAADASYHRLFRFDYIGDILSWTDLMVRIVGNGVIYGLKDGQLPMKPRRTYLMAEVVAPAVRQVRFLLEEREFETRRIAYSNFEEIPRLWVDQNQFQQVIFNLLSNAIKYSFDDPKQFRVEIATAVEGEYYRISCRDWGPGIVEGYERSIFEESVRGPKGLDRVVEGMGLGLWVVRRIVEAHGGYVEVTNLYRPTEVTVYLPTSLASSPPRHQKRRE